MYRLQDTGYLVSRGINKYIHYLTEPSFKYSSWMILMVIQALIISHLSHLKNLHTLKRDQLLLNS